MMSMTTTSNQKYAELEQIQSDLTKQAELLRAHLKSVEGKLAAVIVAIEVWKNNGATTKTEPNPRVKALRGLTQVQALTKIAKESSDNRFRISEVKALLLEAGVVNSKKNATNILYTTILRSGKFKHVGPGEYELLPEQLTGPVASFSVHKVQ
jgi:hypothetical protein